MQRFYDDSYVIIHNGMHDSTILYHISLTFEQSHGVEGSSTPPSSLQSLPEEKDRCCAAHLEFSAKCPLCPFVSMQPSCLGLLTQTNRSLLPCCPLPHASAFASASH